MKKFLTLLFFLPFSIQSANYYWVGGSGNWSDFANHWATTSGGSVFRAQVPQSFDNVLFDANSFTGSGQTVTANQTIIYCNDMDWSGVTNNPTFASLNNTLTFKVYGSFKLNAAMNFNFDGSISFEALGLGKTITTFSRVLPCSIFFNGIGGEWTLKDSLTSLSDISVYYGTLRTNDKNVRGNSFGASVSSGPKALFLGTSIITLPNVFSAFGVMDSITVLDADSCTINLFDGTFTSYGPYVKNNQYKFNIVNFYGTTGFANNSVLKIAYCNIKRATFANGGEIRRPNNLIDSLFCKGDMLINIYPNIHIRSAYITQNFTVGETGPPGHTIDKVVVDGNTFVGIGSVGQDNFFGDALFKGNLSIKMTGCSQTFRKCQILGDGLFNNNNTFDTLILTPARTYTFEANKTQTITKLFDALGQSSYPIQIVSKTIGVQSTLNILQNPWCTNYIYMRDMKGTGGPLLYVGANSNDVSNNTGWFFVACTVGIDDAVNDPAFSISPNPFNTYTTIHIGEGIDLKNAEASVFNVLGKVVKLIKINNTEFQIDKDDLPSGIYFCTISNYMGVLSTVKMIVE